MSTAAICATREYSWQPSLYRGEQFDSDLGLYYLRARYYNPATGRFLSRDPEDGKFWDPKSLHKYLYANGDPVNMIDPRGREALVEDAITYVEVGVATTAELKELGGAIACVFAVEAYVIALANGMNGMDTTLGGLGVDGGCAIYFWTY